MKSHVFNESIVFKRWRDIENLQPELKHMRLEIPGENKNGKLLLGVLYQSIRILNSNAWIEKFLFRNILVFCSLSTSLSMFLNQQGSHQHQGPL